MMWAPCKNTVANASRCLNEGLRFPKDIPSLQYDSNQITKVYESCWEKMHIDV